MIRQVAHCLFFAFPVPPGVADDIVRLRVERGILHRPVARERLHVSLLSLGYHAEPPRDLARSACAMAEGGLPNACRLVFDELVVRPDRSLLLPSEPLPGARRCFEALCGNARRDGLPAFAPPAFRPHVTMAYGPGSAGPIFPVSWVADELLLIDSAVGLTRHDIVGRWRLGR